MAQGSPTFKTLSGLFSFLLVLGGVLPVGMLANVPLASANTYLVNNTNDAGAGSLRQAITDANANGGADIINFDGTLSGTITLASDLPVITQQVAINGNTAQDAGLGVDITLSAAGRTYCLKFDGGAAHSVVGIGCTGATNGFVFTTNVGGGNIGGSASRDLNEINNCSNAAIYVNGGDFLVFKNNQIGLGVANGNGISIDNSSSSITIGGPNPGDSNVIVNSINYGIKSTSASTLNIQGNFIGTGNGSNDLGNAKDGIYISGSSSVSIGGSGSLKNTISGNNENGINLQSGSAVSVIGNRIGVNVAGTGALGNTLAGIRIESAGNIIGSTLADQGNIISANGTQGIRIDRAVANADGNEIMGNFIGVNGVDGSNLGNGGAGILLTGGNILNTDIGVAGINGGNVISKNAGSGIQIDNAGSTGTSIYNNVIGLLQDKSTAAGNTGDGITISGNASLIGETGSPNKTNIISSNGGKGVYLKGTSTVQVAYNIIGYAADAVTARANTDDAIYLDTGANNNIVGSTTAGSNNQIYAAAAKSGVNLNNDAGNGNLILSNNFNGGANFVPIKRGGASNENMVAPTVNPLSTTSYIYGSGATAAGRVEIYGNNYSAAVVTADGSGNWGVHMYIPANQVVTASTSNVSNSTSEMSAPVNLVPDVTAPAAPSSLSPVSETAISANPFVIVGTKDANTSIWNGAGQIVANNGSTSWTASTAIAEGQNNFSFIAKDFSLNSSSTVNYTIYLDTVTPTAPTLSYPSTSTSTVTILGSGTEAGASIYINGADYGTDVDGLGNFSVTLSVQVGSNSISFTIVDKAGNTSAASVATVTNTSGGGSSGGSSSGSNSNNDNTVGDTDDEEQEAMAGEGEEDPVSEVETDTNTDSNETNETITEPEDKTVQIETTTESTTDTKVTPIKNTEPVKSNFYSGIYEYVEPIKVETVRDSFPAQPLMPAKFDEKVFDNKFFGDKNDLGVPQIFIDLKGNGEELTATRDSDGDGAYDVEEFVNGSNPYVKDTDGDGRTDGEELFVDGTDPASYDSDGDGIADAKDETPSTFTAPNVSAQEIATYIAEETITEPVGQVDSDEDGLSDLSEFYDGTDPQVADSDGDGLDDGYEVLSLGTDPNVTTPESAVDSISVVNVNGGGGSFESGSQLYVGHAEADATLSAYEIDENGELILIGETTTDENGSYVLLTSKELSAGKHTILFTTGDSLDTLTDVSLPIEIEVVGYVKKPQFEGLGLQNNASITETRPSLALKASESQMIVVLWKSTVNGQTLIADASDQTLNARPVENLELGEHTVTWYAEDLKTGDKSAPTQIAFNVTNTAFATGETGGSPWTIALGSIAVLASLTALALFYRNRKLVSEPEGFAKQ